jgi:hypothetical protein
MLTPAPSKARQSINIDVPDSARSCADLAVRSSGQVARDSQEFALTKNEAPVLQISAIENAQIRVRGWGQPGYSVEACRIAAAADATSAASLLKSVKVTRSGGRFSDSGPSADDGAWRVIFLVNAPKGGSLDLETTNGPIDARGVDGTLSTRAANGPVSIGDCSGTVDAHASNGPISSSGGGGQVHLTTANGPIAVKMAGKTWNGAGIEARTDNGPLSLAVPPAFRSGVRVEIAGHAPLACGLDACAALRRT